MEDKFIELYNQGYSDTKIAELFGVERHKIHKLRRNLNLPRQFPMFKFAEEIKSFVHSGISDSEISRRLNIPDSTVQHTRKRLKLKTNFVERTYKNKTDRRRGRIIGNLKFSAKKRNLEFNLDYTDLELPKFCPILGFKLVYGKSSNSLLNASVDRIDNSKGYIKGNIIIISRLANLMKNQANLDQLQLFTLNSQKLIDHYKNHGALGSITDLFPDTEMYEET